MNISYYANAKDNKGSVITVDAAIGMIQSDDLKAITEKYRSQYLPKANQAKALLAANEKNENWNLYQLLRKEAKKLESEGKKKGLAAVSAQLQQVKENLQAAADHKIVKACISAENTIESARNFKTQLPMVLWAGTFTKRNLQSLEKGSGLMVIDVDKLTPELLQSRFKLIQQCAFVFLAFISPSGDGIKIIFKVPPVTNDAENKATFAAVANYCKTQLAIDVDPSGKDVCRPCFLCHHAKPYVNNKADLFPVAEWQPIEQPKVTYEAPPINKATERQYNNLGNDFQSIYNFTCNGKYQGSTLGNYEDGKRNVFAFVFACNCSRKGLDMATAESYLYEFASDLSTNELQTILKSAYAKTTHEFGKYRYEPRTQANQKNTANRSQKSNGTATGNTTNQASAQNPQQQAEPNTNTNFKGQNTASGNSNNNDKGADSKKDYTQFWYIIEKEDRSTGEITEQYKVDYWNFIDFLTEQGFGRYKLDKGFQYIRVVDKRVSVIEPTDIKTFVLEWVKERNLRKLYAAMVQGNKSFLATDKFEALPFVELNIKRDTDTTAYLYFQNCIVCIHKDGINTDTYENLNQHIWAGQVIKHNFIAADFDYNNPAVFDNFNEWPCEYARLIKYCSYNHNSEDEKEKSLTQLERYQRFASFCTSIGFLAHTYKHPANRKGIFAIDHKIGERNESNGRTGKSMIMYALENFRIVSVIPGKQYDPAYQFRYEAINSDTQIVVYNDMKRSHDVENEFEIIADNYSINKRNTGFLTFKYSNSAKVYYTTNFIPKGDGESYLGRMHIIEFSDFFSSRHTPYNEFGHGFFDSSWNEEQWNHFYNFMVYCIKTFLTVGLVEYPKGNYSERKLKNDTPEEFIDFMDARELTSNELQRYKWNEYTEKKVLLERWNNEARSLGMQMSNAAGLYRMVKKYCEAKKIQFWKKKAGGNEHYWIGDKAPEKGGATVTKVC